MRVLLGVLQGLVIAGCVSGQSGAASTPTPAPDRTAAKPKRPRVMIIGASVSAGFADPTSRGPDGEANRAFRLDEALKKTIWPRADARLTNVANLAMFQSPERFGKRQIASVRKLKPDLVIGVDFLAWFGYGAARDPRTGKAAADKVRLAQLEKGLRLLAGLSCPLVVGDFPDMRNASTHMLPKYMIPNLATQQALNARLAKWAKDRKNVFVFPIAKFASEATTKAQKFAWGEGRTIVFPKNFLLQSDRLHATRVGTLVIVYRMAQAFPSILPKSHPLLRPGITLKGLVEQADLLDRVPDPLPEKRGEQSGSVRKQRAPLR